MDPSSSSTLTNRTGSGGSDEDGGEGSFQSFPLKDGDEFTRAAVEDSLSYKAFAGSDSADTMPPISKVRLAVSTVVGALLGMVLSIAVNSVLFEISINRVFAFYFGIIFCILGSLIFMRAWTQPTLMKKLGVTLISAMVITGGALSLIFRTEWLWWSSAAKVVIYTLLGIATSFTVTFSWVDIISFIHDMSKRAQMLKVSTKFGLIESQTQIWLLVVVSVVTGLTYGLIFGLVQLEEMTVQHHSRQRLMNSLGRTELFSLPFGAGIGAVSAALNEYVRHRTMIQAIKNEIEYKPLNQSDIDGV